ncbi:tetratricopeptide repeat protein [Wenzhouxiangella sp. AB-CW3]|uniref:tetratricopeptide repeat protein n=1 Tax=Wenzhouxiangella sp. AB-CW3 TaxID=2771012 RepID=UPI00168B0007|nr:tetratricopeptide repeat protein [Wenzhouxiangella sp. AB-CW3]QOC22840.1 tetratricopeptide repeat protein [Wenzhouxiangella sp. AB-CW3]
MNLFSTVQARLLAACTLCMGLMMTASLVWAETLNPQVAGDLLDAYEEMEEDNYDEALRLLNRLMDRRGDAMTPFDRASVLQIRGSAHVNLDMLDEAIDDFRTVLRLDALPSETQNQMRLNLGQLYFMTERFEESLEFFDEWIGTEGVEITHSTWFMIAAANYNLENYEDALEPISTAMELVDEPTRRYYDLKNVLLSNLERTEERTELMAEMVQHWPEELPYWRQLASLYMEQDDMFRAFAIMEAAYVNDMLSDESDIVMLAQYYSNFDNPHRGANLLEKEMEAGRVERNVDNLQMLSQMLSQAREHRRSIPVLREAAELSDDGRLFFRLGQALMASENNEDAEEAFAAAIDQGGLDSDKLGEAWLLLGNSRLNQAGPGDRDQRMSADEAFAEAARFPIAQRQANEWRSYIEAINTTERRQAQLEQEQQERLAEAAEDRLLTACRAQQLGGRRLSEECERLLEEDRRRREEPVEPEAETQE